jgi:type IV secretory pathway VirB2 component (pilin)
MKKLIRILAGFICSCSLVLMKSMAAFAGTTGMPWETPLARVRDSLTGPVAYSVVIISIVVAGILSFINRQTEGIFHTMISIIIVAALIFGAVTIVNLAFPSASGLAF